MRADFGRTRAAAARRRPGRRCGAARAGPGRAVARVVWPGDDEEHLGGGEEDERDRADADGAERDRARQGRRRGAEVRRRSAIERKRVDGAQRDRARPTTRRSTVELRPVRSRYARERRRRGAIIRCAQRRAGARGKSATHMPAPGMAHGCLPELRARGWAARWRGGRCARR